MAEKENQFKLNKNDSINCDDIYAEEMKKSINTTKRFREAWLCSSTTWDADLFQYADSDFYFYRFAVGVQERNVESLLTNILYRLMERYGIVFEVPDNIRIAPFAFIISGNEGRTGYRFNNFFERDDVNKINKMYDVKEAIIIRAWKPDKAYERILRENEQHRRKGQELKSISIKVFFEKYFSDEEYNSFETHIKNYLQSTRDIIGYQSIKFLSSMNLATKKLIEEKELSEWDYRNYKFQIIDKTNKKIQNYLYLDRYSMPVSILQAMKNNYVSSKLFKTMIGTNDYAVSFITSEWLYSSLKGRKNFDYTSVISGYLKSIEQLLYKIVMLNVDNNCKISMSGASEIITSAISNNITTYKPDDKTDWRVVCPNSKGYKYIDLISTQLEYMEKSIGTFEYFLRKNPQIFIDPLYAKTIADMVCCFRAECRNGYFHIHNLNDWETVEKTRNNAIYLYFVLLGSCKIPSNKISELGMSSEDKFDMLCKTIREFRHYNLKFIFEYSADDKRNLIYDSIGNTAEYTDAGVEHYEQLLFYDVKEFTADTYEKLDAGLFDDNKVYLRRDNMPCRIYGVYRDGNTEQLL